MFTIRYANETLYACTDSLRFARQMIRWARVKGASFLLNGKPITPQDLR